MSVSVRAPDLLTTAPDTIRARSDMRAREIVADVTASVASGSLRPGDRLPDERSLCRRYVAGRHTVRKAMDTLERQGLIGRFVGRGSFVLETVRQDTVPRLLQPSANWRLFELTEARLLLEPGVAALAVERKMPGDLVRLERCVAAVTRSTTWRDFKEAKYAFHRTIAEIARNDFVCHIFDQIIASRREVWDSYRPRTQDLAAVRTTSVEECTAILGAIAGGDAERAAEAVRRSVTRILVSIGGS